MKYRWPILDVYGVPDSEALISKCLETLHGLTLMEQFGTRRIVALYARPLLVEGGLACSEDGFVLCFDSSVRDMTGNRCVTTAHELGHTFEFKLKTLELFIEKRSSKYVDASEDFAEAFAHRWLSDIRRTSELQLFLERHFAMTFERHTYIDLRSLGYP
ncbi:MAG: hypothetical protein Q8P17_02320 [bacterium]|nr:hypothetical protein [bacterium]